VEFPQQPDVSACFDVLRLKINTNMLSYPFFRNLARPGRLAWRRISRRAPTIGSGGSMSSFWSSLREQTDCGGHRSRKQPAARGSAELSRAEACVFV